VGADDVRALQDQLAATPGDVALRQRTAEALDDSGQHAAAHALLARFVNLGAHDDESELPCLCARCLPQAGQVARADELTFHRGFAVSGDRVLHFWMLADQEPERAAVRASVAGALRARLSAKGRG